MVLTALVIGVVAFFIGLISLLWIFRKERTRDASSILYILTSVAFAIIVSISYVFLKTKGWL